MVGFWGRELGGWRRGWEDAEETLRSFMCVVGEGWSWDESCRKWVFRASMSELVVQKTVYFVQ